MKNVLLCLLLWVGFAQAQHLQIVSPDWSIASTLTAIGYPPLAMGDKRTYPVWVRVPPQPESVIDLGARYQPNRELLAQLSIDKVLSLPFYAHLRSVFSADIPQQEVLFDGGNTEPQQHWETYVTATREIGAAVGDLAAAERYLRQVENQLAQYGREIRQAAPEVESYATVLFADAHRLRIYASNSMFHVAFELMGLKQVDLGVGDRWGSYQVALQDLAKLPPKTCLLILGPFHRMTEAELKQSYTWQRMGFGTERCVRKMPAVWLFGGTDTIGHFAHELHHAMVLGEGKWTVGDE